MALRIDAHQHFWMYDPIKYGWITDDMSAIQTDFLPENLTSLLDMHNIDGTIAVQCEHTEENNNFLLRLASQYSFIKGVVGWVDLTSNIIKEQLDYWHQFPKLKGFRHILQSESIRDYMLQPSFTRGIGYLHKYDFTFDILIYNDQLSFLPPLVQSFPDQPFVIDHIGKPDIRNGKIKEWMKEMDQFKFTPNVFCKISGLVTEAEWKTWKKEDLLPYMDKVVEVFGTERIMFGSDWPVCLVAASYDQVFETINDYFSSFSKTEQQGIFGGNAARFYQIN